MKILRINACNFYCRFFSFVWFVGFFFLFEISNIMRLDNLNLEYKRNSFYKERNLHINKARVSIISHLHCLTQASKKHSILVFWRKPFRLTN